MFMSLPKIPPTKMLSAQHFRSDQPILVVLEYRLAIISSDVSL
jgi:hypothetical protein